ELAYRPNLPIGIAATNDLIGDLAHGAAEAANGGQINVGGQMGGLLAYRDTVLDSSYNKLGQLALTFADTVNKQLGQGLDLAGKAGANLF
ncbi:FlgK family flagellar hook-associated protein, partial [Pseudomonas aeruginosa]|uniref:FlgK family flagellar hook-associated protein n=1 Tax=Pseudomonas aeruginosa TaxID=287 RepID=UPI003D9FECE7|nr:hypothetical protein [Pseudomonas aeruginosa]